MNVKPSENSNRRWTQVKTRILVFKIALFCCLVSNLGVDANADFVVLSRDSEINLESTNFGGVEQHISTTSVEDPFQFQLADSVEHTEAGGNINGGIWTIFQDSTVSPALLRVDMQTETLTQQIFGKGIGILVGNNTFEVEFEVTEETDIELGGTYFGTSDTLFADDFVRIRFQQDNGVTFITLFQTSDADQLNVPFIATLVPGTVYRVSVESSTISMGAEYRVSGASVCLRPITLAGDVNGDGLVNLLDVAPFIDAIADGIYSSEADVNCDGLINLLDVEPFVSILAGV